MMERESVTKLPIRLCHVMGTRWNITDFINFLDGRDEIDVLLYKKWTKMIIYISEGLFRCIRR